MAPARPRIADPDPGSGGGTYSTESTPDLMTVDEQHDAIDEDRRRAARGARRAAAALMFGGTRAAGERLEPQQQPHRIVGDVEHERAVGAKVCSVTLRPLGSWRDATIAPQSSEQRAIRASRSNVGV